ncbi:unnamed protein product [Dicrocoelium dendriticum]|nr:unnamed protein product [Dicrocoelium dendriticum]
MEEDTEKDRKQNLLNTEKDRSKGTGNSVARHVTYKPDSVRYETRGRKILRWFKNVDNLFVVLTVLAVILGSSLGLLIKVFVDPSPRTVYLVSFPGELLMNMLKMLIIPLIVSSLVAGLAGLDPKSSGKIGTYALIYYVVTTMLAVFLGIALVLSIRPGNSSIKQSMGEGTIEERRPETLDSFLDLLRNLFPENIVQACLQQLQSQFVTVVKKPNDRIRTSINVLGDAVGAGIVDHLCRKELAEKDAEIDRELDMAVEEYSKHISLPSSPVTNDGISPSGFEGRRFSKKRISVAAAMRLQENASPLSSSITPGSILEHSNAIAMRTISTGDPPGDITL